MKAPQFGDQSKDDVRYWIHKDFFIDLDESANDTEFDKLSNEMIEIEK